MFKLNEIQRTKDGELLKPFTVQGDMVLCSDKNGVTVKKFLEDFDFSAPKEKKVLSVQPVKKQEKIVEIDEEQSDDKLFENDIQEEEVFEPDTEENTGTDEEPEEDTGGSIWDDVDDGYV